MHPPWLGALNLVCPLAIGQHHVFAFLDFRGIGDEAVCNVSILILYPHESRGGERRSFRNSKMIDDCIIPIFLQPIPFLNPGEPVQVGVAFSKSLAY